VDLFLRVHHERAVLRDRLVERLAGDEPIALPYLQRGELIEVLSDWQPPQVSAWAVFPGRRLMPARTRVLLDALIAKFTGEECQAEEEKVQTAKKRLGATPPRTIAANAGPLSNDKR